MTIRRSDRNATADIDAATVLQSDGMVTGRHCKRRSGRAGRRGSPMSTRVTSRASSASCAAATQQRAPLSGTAKLGSEASQDHTYKGGTR
jgi:hypothetical protein